MRLEPVPFNIKQKGELITEEFWLGASLLGERQRHTLWYPESHVFYCETCRTPWACIKLKGYGGFWSHSFLPCCIEHSWEGRENYLAGSFCYTAGDVTEDLPLPVLLWEIDLALAYPDWKKLTWNIIDKKRRPSLSTPFLADDLLGELNL